ncbi:5'-3' exonuclease [Pseudofrankia inefficax]|uniref:5'-3' exonuclease n=1 Tax=Pseudofrankia inefficax (strain DSM 45817 / CECT 9037 / DDB 130130 / EuI1c) TaxID=298654 RepID=E3J1J7_PSEI1|nr:5'-3' exonuclease, N-terminal resolvase-like domain protein [Pseudofrankia inefficax]
MSAGTSETASEGPARPVREQPGAAGPGGGLLLVDTPSLYFRAFYGVPQSVTAPDGMPVNAVRGLLDVLARQIADLRPAHLVCCFDGDWRPAFRVELVESYKAHRVADVLDPAAVPPSVPVSAAATPGPAGTTEGVAAGAVAVEEVPDELTPQLPVIDAVLDAFGICRVEAAGFEADDVIGTLATRFPHGDAAGWAAQDRGEAPAGGGPFAGPVEILTGDRDLFQLVRDDVPVRVRYSVEKFAAIDEAAVSARYGVPGRAYGDFATLRGDPSDGLPGVAGIGAKTAAALLTRFGSLAGALAALDAGQTDGFPAGARRRLEAARDYLDRAEVVVRVVPDVPLPALATRLPATPAHPDEVLALAERFGLAGAATRLTRALTAAARPA